MNPLIMHGSQFSETPQDMLTALRIVVEFLETHETSDYPLLVLEVAASDLERIARRLKSIVKRNKA